MEKTLVVDIIGLLNQSMSLQEAINAYEDDLKNIMLDVSSEDLGRYTLSTLNMFTETALIIEEIAGVMKKGGVLYGLKIPVSTQIALAGSSAAVDLLDATLAIEEDRQNPFIRGYSKQTSIKVFKAGVSGLQFFTAVLGAFPAFKTNPVFMSVELLLSVAALVASSAAKKYEAELSISMEELSSTFKELGLDTEDDLMSVWNRSNTEDYVGKNWSIVTPFIHFILRLTNIDGKLTGKQARENTIGMIESINAGGLDRKPIHPIFGNKFAANESFAMMQCLEVLFGAPLMPVKPIDGIASGVYAMRLHELFEGWVKKDINYTFISLIEGAEKINVSKFDLYNNDLSVKSAHRYAFIMGNSFVITGVDYTSIRGNHDHHHLDDDKLFTKEFIKARSKYLEILTEYYLEDASVIEQSKVKPLNPKDMFLDYRNKLGFGDNGPYVEGNWSVRDHEGVFTNYIFDLESFQTLFGKAINTPDALHNRQVINNKIFSGYSGDIIHFGRGGNDYVEGGYGDNEYHISGTSSVLEGEDKGHYSYSIMGNNEYFIKDFTGKYTAVDLSGDSTYHFSGKCDKALINIVDETGHGTYNFGDSKQGDGRLYGGVYSITDVDGKGEIWYLGEKITTESNSEWTYSDKDGWYYGDPEKVKDPLHFSLNSSNDEQGMFTYNLTIRSYYDTLQSNVGNQDPIVVIKDFRDGDLGIHMPIEHIMPGWTPMFMVMPGMGQILAEFELNGGYPTDFGRMPHTGMVVEGSPMGFRIVFYNFTSKPIPLVAIKTTYFEINYMDYNGVKGKKVIEIPHYIETELYE